MSNQQLENQTTFIRCPHDAEHPYVMIATAMLRDKSISPKAKGVLCYLLSLPRQWTVYHKQLKDGLNIGEEYLNSAMDELLKAGYARRTRKQGKENGRFQPYHYEFSELKKFLPDRVSRTGFPGLENPVLSNIEGSNIEEQQQHSSMEQQAPKTAVAFSAKQDQGKKAIYESLLPIDIPDSDKEQITQTYSEANVKHAVAWATHPETKINKTLVQAIKWACKAKPEIPLKEDELIAANREIAKPLDGKQSTYAKIIVLHSGLEITYPSCPNKEPTVLSFSLRDFKSHLADTLKKFGFPCPV